MNLIPTLEIAINRLNILSAVENLHGETLNVVSIELDVSSSNLSVMEPRKRELVVEICKY